MATINDPGNAVQRLHVIMRDNDTKDADGNPVDNGLVNDIGAAILHVADKCGEYVERTGKAFKGKVAVEFEIHASPDGKMVEYDLGMKPIVTKVPPLTTQRKARFWRGSDGELSTVPVQKDQMVFPALRPVDGGKQDAAKPAVKVV